MNAHSLIFRRLVAVASVAVLAGCASTREPEFGSSVRHMVQGQEFDPAPASEVMGAVDGEKASMAVKAYRTETKSGEGMATPALILPGL